MISPGRPFRYSEGTHQNGMRDAVYQTGPQIVYGTTSVYRVEQRENRDDTNVEQERLSYVLRPLYQDGRILTPVENPKVVMGPRIFREEAEQLIDSIPRIRAQADHTRGFR